MGTEELETMQVDWGDKYKRWAEELELELEFKLDCNVWKERGE